MPTHSAPLIDFSAFQVRNGANIVRLERENKELREENGALREMLSQKDEQIKLLGHSREEDSSARGRFIKELQEDKSIPGSPPRSCKDKLGSTTPLSPPGHQAPHHKVEPQDSGLPFSQETTVTKYAPPSKCVPWPDILHGRKPWNSKQTWDRPHHGIITPGTETEINDPEVKKEEVMDDDSRPEKVVRGGSIIQTWLVNERGQYEKGFGLVHDLRAKIANIRYSEDGKKWAKDFVAIVSYFAVEAENAADRPMMAYLRGEEFIEEEYAQAARRPHCQLFPFAVCQQELSDSILDVKDPGFIIPVAAGIPPPAPLQRWFRYAYNPDNDWGKRGEFWHAHDPDGKLHWPLKLESIHDWVPRSGNRAIDRDHGWDEPRYADEEVDECFLPREYELSPERAAYLNRDIMM